MRLIDADELFESIEYNISDPHYKDIVLTTINFAPTIEAEPVRHGHWIKSKDFTLMCSICGDIAPYESNYYGDVIGTEKYPYCPYCGTKMDEERDN